MSKKLIRSVLWRALITFGILVVYCLSIDVYHMVESPMKGVTTANALDDTMASYVTAKFVREDGIPTYLFLIALFLFLLTWFSLILRVARTPAQPNQPTT